MLLVSLQAHWPLLSHLYCCFLLPAQPLAARKPWTFLSSTIAPSFSEFMTTHMSQCPPQICPPAQSSLLNSRLMPSLLHVTSRRFSLLVPKAASLPSPVSCLLVGNCPLIPKILDFFLSCLTSKVSKSCELYSSQYI